VPKEAVRRITEGIGQVAEAEQQAARAAARAARAAPPPEVAPARLLVAVDGVQVHMDSYHAWEHLWRVANAVSGTGSAAAAAWTEPLKRCLEQEGVAPAGPAR
jgi:hypothetical protein